MKTTTTKQVRMMSRACGLAVVAAVSVSSAHAASATTERASVAFVSSVLTMSVQTGCAPATRTRVGCQSPLRAYSGLDDSGLGDTYRCEASIVTTNAARVSTSAVTVEPGTDNGGPCVVSKGARVGTATVTQTSHGCGDVRWYGLTDSKIYLTDPNGDRWLIDALRLHTDSYRHEGVDMWTLSQTVTGDDESYLHAVSGPREMRLTLMGTLTSMGWCEIDGASSDYTMSVVATGWITAPLG